MKFSYSPGNLFFPPFQVVQWVQINEFVFKFLNFIKKIIFLCAFWFFLKKCFRHFKRKIIFSEKNSWQKKGKGFGRKKGKGFGLKRKGEFRFFLKKIGPKIVFFKKIFILLQYFWFQFSAFSFFLFPVLMPASRFWSESVLFLLSFL